MLSSDDEAQGSASKSTGAEKSMNVDASLQPAADDGPPTNPNVDKDPLGEVSVTDPVPSHSPRKGRMHQSKMHAAQPTATGPGSSDDNDEDDTEDESFSFAQRMTNVGQSRPFARAQRKRLASQEPQGPEAADAQTPNPGEQDEQSEPDPGPAAKSSEPGPMHEPDPGSPAPVWRSSKEKGKARATAGTPQLAPISKVPPPQLPPPAKPPPRPFTPVRRMASSSRVGNCTPRGTRARTRELLLRAWRPVDGLVDCDYLTLLNRIIDIDMRTCPSRHNSIMHQQHRDDPAAFIEEATAVLYQIHEDVVEGLIRGDLSQRYQSRQDVREHVFKYHEEVKDPSATSLADHPCLYVNYVVDVNTGPGVLKAHVEKLCDQLELLTVNPLSSEGQQLLTRLGDWLWEKRIRTQNRIDVFRHCSSSEKESDEELRLHQVPNILNFVQTVRVLTAQLSGSDAGLTFPEVGLSMPGSSLRVAAHQSLKSTPIILTLVRGVLETFFPHQYHLRSYVVAYVMSDWDLRMGEAIISNLASAYITTGGCNHHEAVNAIGSSDEEDWDKVVNDLQSAGVFSQADDITRRFGARVDAARVMVENAKRKDASKLKTAYLQQRKERAEDEIELIIEDLVEGNHDIEEAFAEWDSQAQQLKINIKEYLKAEAAVKALGETPEYKTMEELRRVQQRFLRDLRDADPPPGDEEGQGQKEQEQGEQGEEDEE